MYYHILDISKLDLNLDFILNIAEEAYSDPDKWFYAEPQDVINEVGKERVFKDAETSHNYIEEKILKRINPIAGKVYSTFYKLPANNGFSPIHVDYETCNILIPLHDTQKNAYVHWYKWQENMRELTDEDWELYNSDWNKYPICKFKEDLPIVETYFWKKGEAVLLNTREPHSSHNYHYHFGINLTINFYDVTYADLVKLYNNGLMFI